MTNIQSSIASLKSLGFSNSYIVSGLASGIAECQRFIDKEQGRNSSLRPEKEQQYLDFCIAHKQKLEEAVADLGVPLQ